MPRSAVNGPPGTKRIMKKVAVMIAKRTGIVSSNRRVIKRSMGRNQTTAEWTGLPVARREVADGLKRLSVSMMAGQVEKRFLGNAVFWRFRSMEFAAS